MKAPSDAPMRFHQFFARAPFSLEKCPEKKRSDLPRISKRDDPERVARTDTRARRTNKTSHALPRLRHDLGHVDLRPFFREFAD
jgi:hypothetical protein